MRSIPDGAKFAFSRRYGHYLAARRSCWNGGLVGHLHFTVSCLARPAMRFCHTPSPFYAPANQETGRTVRQDGVRGEHGHCNDTAHPVGPNHVAATLSPGGISVL